MPDISPGLGLTDDIDLCGFCKYRSPWPQWFFKKEKDSDDVNKIKL